MTESKLYEFADRVGSFLALNLLWLLACLPIVTIFPATAALFAVVRDWQRSDDFRVFPLYFQLFREHLRAALGLAAIWTLLGAALAANALAIGAMPETVQWIFYTLNSFLTLVFLAVSAFLFPVVAHYRVGALDALRLAFIFSGQRIMTTLACVLILATVAALSWVMPITVLVSGAPTAYVIYALCRRAFPSLGPDRADGTNAAVERDDAEAGAGAGKTGWR